MWQGILDKTAQIKRSALIVFCVLWIPAISLWVTTPPLWRDTDSWHQLTSPPNMATLIHFGPAYCFGIRGPMWVGTVLGAALGQNEMPKADFFRRPVLTDAGILAALVVQQALLVGALTLLICAASSQPGVRLFLTALALTQIPLYLYAHCPSTETLTIPLILALTALLRWIGDKDRLNPWIWLGYFGLLLIAILTRHPNAVLAAVLPGYFLLQLAITRLRSGPVPWRTWTKPFALAVVVGLITVIAAQGLNRLFCWSANQLYRSSAGYTLQWKLGYMSEMTPEVRRAYWESVLGPNRATEFSPLILGINPDGFKKEGFWIPRTSFLQVQAEVAKQNPTMKKSETAALAEQELNALVKPFLLRGGQPYWESVRYDFLQGFTWAPSAIVNQLVENTAYYFDENLRADPRYTSIFELASFRNKDGVSVRAQYWSNPLFHWFPYWLPAHWVYLLVALVLTGGLIASRDPAAWNAAAVVLSLLAASLVLWFLTKLLTQNLPRFASPLYTALVAMVLYGAGQLMTMWTGRGSRSG